ncbi:MAG: type II toxin-antitoxin system prevent-host-death family antitoxin [Thermaerobacter sp.]|nr:type II toxin-antitoxin system prevent-host-death family antitoxin [Thermaerobacter sp.]
MRVVNIHEAKTHLSRLVEDVATRREPIVIAKAGKPMARLVPLVPERPRRVFGLLAGQIRIADDFDAPLPDDVLKNFEGSEL